ncbi:signal peptidase I [Laceyella putida]|uniref:Signal peptidase I n=1 Tax=Laceyella putida TaxID=110101 RepID=A0ABW2RI52_9BACL
MLQVRRLYGWAMLLIYACLFAWTVNHYGIAFSVVNGTSMQPTLHDGDHLLINKFQFLLDKPKVGDVITFRDPSDPERYLVKRVIGLPGDTIEIRQGRLYRNGKQVREPYIDSLIEDGDFGPVKVRKETVFVMGDNRHRYASRDSRYSGVGLVPFTLIDGKVELILWRPSLATPL